VTLTVLSLNTAVDRTLVVPGLQVGGIYRAGDVYAEAGGKGLNVARFLRQLGEPVRVVGFLGGTATQFIRKRLDAAGIEQHWVETEGESRTCLILLDGEAHPPTVVNEPGPVVRAAEVAMLRRTIFDLIKPDDTVCLSGSAPPGLPPGFTGEIVSTLQSRGARVLVDTSEARLPEALQASPWAVTPTDDEARGTLGSMPPVELALALAAHSQHVVLTRGAQGAIYAESGEAWQLTSPPIVALNPIASGDALVAGFLSRIERGASGLDSARFGVACGTSNAARIAPSLPDLSAIEEVETGVTVRQIGERGRG
jgi:tagatose 6-phosphate kinase